MQASRHWRGITALAAVDALELSAQDAVLIVGATGGVGSFAVQLAAHAGATVIAPALPDDEDYLRGLGAAELLDRDGDISATVRERHPDGVAAVLDLVSYAPGTYDAALADGGRLGVAARGGRGRARPRKRHGRLDPENLDGLGGLLADGTLKAHSQDSYELVRAGEALQALATTHTQGKLAIRVA